MTDFLDEKKREIKSRMEELKPLVDEYRRLQDAHDALDGVGATSRSGGGRRAIPKGPGEAGSNGTSRGRGRPKGSGTRAKEALQFVKDRPGITIPEIAEAMDIKQNYLYRVMPDLEKDGLVRKEGRGWHPLQAA